MNQIELQQQQQQLQQQEVHRVTPLKSSSAAELEDSLSPFMPSAVSGTSASPSAQLAASESPVADDDVVPTGPTSYDLAVEALQISINEKSKMQQQQGSPTADDKSIRSGASSIKTRHTAAASIESGASSKHSPSAKRSPPKAGSGISGRYSGKVVPVSASMLNKSEKAAFDIIVSAKKSVAGAGGGGNASAKAAATVALTQVEIALMKR